MTPMICIDTRYKLSNIQTSPDPVQVQFLDADLRIASMPLPALLDPSPLYFCASRCLVDRRMSNASEISKHIDTCKYSNHLDHQIKTYFKKYRTIFIDSAKEEYSWILSVWKCSKPLTFFIDRMKNQRFGRRRSRFDNTFKGKGAAVESKWVRCLHIRMNIFTSIIRWWTQVWVGRYFPRRQLVVWCQIPREHRIQLRITSCHLSVFQDIY